MFGDIFKGRYELYHPPVADGNTNACLLTGKSEYSAEEVKTLLEKSYQYGYFRGAGDGAIDLLDLQGDLIPEDVKRVFESVAIKGQREMNSQIATGSLRGITVHV